MNPISNELEEWLRSLVKALRNHTIRDPALKDELSNLDWFLKPCQITALWFTDPETQIVIVTHFDDVRDLSIDVYGPTPAYMFTEIALKVAKKDWWNRNISSKDKQSFVGVETYKDLIEGVLVSAKSFLQSAPFIRPTTIQRKTALTFTRKDFAWFIRGNLTALDVNYVIKKIVDEARIKLQQKVGMQKKEAKKKEKKPKSRTELVDIKGYCAYMYPFLWILEVPKLTLQQRLSGIIFPNRLRKLVKEAEILSTRTLIFNDGLVFVQTENKRLALKIINLLAASMLINKISMFICRELDLIEAVLSKDRHFTSMEGKLLSPRVEAAFKPELLQERMFSVKIGREHVVSEEELVRVISTAKKLSMNSNLSTMAIALLETYTHFNTGNYREAFVCGWAIIEYYINMLWKTQIEREVEKRRRNKLRDPNYMDIDHIIEVLSLLNRINKEEYTRVMKLKEIRNKVVHKLYEPSVEEVEKLINVTSNIIRIMVKNN